MKVLEFTIAFPFCGLGAGAYGFLQAQVELCNRRARFRSLGGIDFDPLACKDFETLTGSPALCADVAKLKPSDLRAFFGNEAPDVVFLSPPCLPGDGLVLTSSGPRRIDDVRANDLVLTHRGRYRRVLSVGSERYAGELFGFRLHGTAEPQWFTPEHPLWVRSVRRTEASARRRHLGPDRFAPAKEVAVGDRIGFPIDAEVAGTGRNFIASVGDPKSVVKGGKSQGRYAKPAHAARLERIADLRPLAESVGLWFLLGAYLGDGYRRPSRHEVIYCVGASDGPLAERVKTELTALGLRFFVDFDGGRTNVKIRIHARHLCLLCGLFGDGAESKDVPEPLMHVERPLLDALIDGYRATDGSQRPRRERTAGSGSRFFQAAWKIVSTSLPLLRGIQRLLLRRREFGAIHVAWPGGQQTIMGRIVQTLPRWEIRVASGATKRTTFEFIGGAVWVRVRQTMSRPYADRVWNLEVDEDDTFCAPMMATHNCKGASGLLSQKLADTEKYRTMNDLALRWTEMMVEAWTVPPRLVLLENVPRLKTRAGAMVKKVTALLRRAGYVVTDGFHDCGELGGLAQHRRRFLLVARHQKRVPPILYQPIKRRVRACGEVLGPLPMPGDPAGGPMHALPKISWLNWVRLALIPAGGDWRDLPGVLSADEKRREKFKRHAVEDWADPTGTVGGSGTNGVANVADPRPFGNVDRVTAWDEPTGTVTTSPAPSSGGGAVADPRILGLGVGENAHRNKYKVADWEDPAPTVIGATRPGSGAPSVADPRVGEWYRGSLGVKGWGDPSGTVTGNGRPASGPFSVADPRAGGWFHNVLRVVPWTEPAGTVTSGSGPTNGGGAVADPRCKTGYDHGYHVLPWSSPSFTVAGGSHPGQGAYSVADIRIACAARHGAYGVVPWTEAAKTVTGAACIDNGAFAVADPRFPDAPPLILIRDIRKPPSAVPVIMAEDGTWHRPLTTLELAALQGMPVFLNGAPLVLAGTSQSAWRERIGNAVPPPAGLAMGERMLVTLVQADAESWTLSSGGEVWVQPEVTIQ